MFEKLSEFKRNPGEALDDIRKGLESHIGELVLVEKQASASEFIGGAFGTAGGLSGDKYTLGVIREPALLEEEHFELWIKELLEKRGGDVSNWLSYTRSVPASFEIVVDPKVNLRHQLHKTKGPEDYLVLDSGNILFSSNDLGLAKYINEMGGFEKNKRINVEIIKFNVYSGDSMVEGFIRENSHLFYRGHEDFFEYVNNFVKDEENIKRIRGCEVAKRRENLLIDIYTAVNQQKILSEEYARLQENAKSLEKGDSGFGREDIFFSGGGKALGDLAAGEGKIRELLKKAMKTGLSDWQGTYVLESGKGLDSRINVKEYIAGLLETYSAKK